MSINLDNYVEVHDRIAAFHERYPDGSLQSQWSIEGIADATLIVVEARAFRTADDQRPGVGLASEPFPGKTPYTRDSELMNAETSAWARAIAALGFEVKRGVATREEVQGKGQNGGEAKQNGRRSDADPANERQRKFVHDLLKQFSDNDRISVQQWICREHERLVQADADFLIDNLKERTEAGRVAELNAVIPKSDVPADTADLD